MSQLGFFHRWCSGCTHTDLRKSQSLSERLIIRSDKQITLIKKNKNKKTVITSRHGDAIEGLPFLSLGEKVKAEDIVGYFLPDPDNWPILVYHRKL